METIKRAAATGENTENPVLKDTGLVRVARIHSTIGNNDAMGFGWRTGRTYIVQRNETPHMAYKTWGTHAGFASLNDALDYAAVLNVRMEKEAGL